MKEVYSIYKPFEVLQSCFVYHV